MVVVQLHNVDLPENFVGRAVFDGNGQVTTIVETSKLTGDDRTGVQSAGLGLLGVWYILSGEEGGVLASETLTGLQEV